MTQNKDGNGTLEFRKMFNDPSKPVHEQIFEEMLKPEYGYKKDAIEFARKKIFKEHDLNFTMNLAQTLAMLQIGNVIFDAVDQGKIPLQDSGDVKP